MLRHWLSYLTALAASLLFYISYTKRFSGYVLLLVILFPVFNLLISLPAIFMVKLSFTTDRLLLQREETTTLHFRADCLLQKISLPVPIIRAELRSRNLLTGETILFPLRFQPGNGFAQLSRPFTSPHCGLIEHTLLAPKAYDLLGLFRLPLKTPSSISVLVTPEGKSSSFAKFPSHPGKTVGDSPLPRQGAAFGPDVREYRKGDSLRSVHWKLTARLGKLLVREPEDTAEEPRISLFCEISGAPHDIDETLTYIAGASQFYLQREIPLELFWFDSIYQRVRSIKADNPADCIAFFKEALASPAPETSYSLQIYCVGLKQILEDEESLYISKEGIQTLREALHFFEDISPKGGAL